MRKKIQTLAELKDSKLLYDKDIPVFGYMLVAAVALLLIGVIIWSVFAPKPYMITASGTVTSENANYVMTAVTGTLAESNVTEGLLVEQGDVLFAVESTDYNLQIQQLEENRAYYTQQMEQYKKLVRSIKDDTNYFSATASGDSFYYSSFEAYKSQVAQNKFDASTYKAYGYTDEQIEIEIEKNQAKIVELYHSAIQSAENSANECQGQVASIDAQLAALQTGKGTYEITATTSGVVHLLADYKTGMVVQAGSAVAIITPVNEEMIIEAYISPADRVKINNGNEVKISVSGLTQSVYGTISGKVIQIDSNATTQEGNEGENATFFKIKVKPDYCYLTSKAGEKIDLTNGMSVEARIQYDKVTYFHYVIEKLGFKVS